MTRIILVSDTHEMHDKVQIPDGDILIHAGDFTMIGEIHHTKEFGDWLRWQSKRFKHVVLIAGNHDLLNERRSETARFLLEGENIHYLEDQLIDIDGLRFYGSPWTPRFGSGWAFNADSAKMKEVTDKIPECDVLITHGPPRGILDKTLEGDLAGCPHLRNAVERLKPRIHCFGHIHESAGYESASHTAFFNASVVDRLYRVVNKPWVVNL